MSRETHYLSGTWKLTVQMDDGSGDEDARFKITQTGGDLSAEVVDTSLPSPINISLNGSKLSLSSHPSEKGIFSFEGILDPSHTRAKGTVEIEFRPKKNSDQSERLTFSANLEFLDEQTLQQEKADAALKEKRMNDAKTLLGALRNYAGRNNGAFPSTLAQLPESDLSDPTLIGLEPRCRITYTGKGQRLVDRDEIVAITKEFSAIPDSREKLVEEERRLREKWKSDVPTGCVVSIDYDDPPLTITIDSLGMISTSNACQIEVTPDTIATMRENEFGNLKHLMLVVTMYSHEHKGFMPGGWLSIYPEYLSNPAVLHSPWEDEGKLSYDLIFPGETQEYLEKLADGLLESLELSNPIFKHKQDNKVKDSKMSAVLQSVYQCLLSSITPLLISRSNLPTEAGQPPARAVAFLDGHVEAVPLSEWDARITPFLHR